MKQYPRLTTERLLLRQFKPDDAHDIQKLAGEFEIADTTLNIPHPYEDGMAEQWISTHQETFENGKGIVFAVVHLHQNNLMGAIGLHDIDMNHETAELGYWIGKPYWGNGYCSEAGYIMLYHAFTELNLNRIYAHHFKRNPASGRVMQKLGMSHEGSLRQHVKKWNRYEDLEMYGILKDEFLA